MGISKISKAETKKILLRPGIFILTFILIAVLASSAFIFTPTPRQNQSVNIIQNTVSEIYTIYNESVSVNAKSSFDSTYITATNTLIDQFNLPNTDLDNLMDKLDDTMALYSSYYSAIVTVEPTTTLNIIKNNLKNSITTLRDTYNLILEDSIYSILIDYPTHLEFLQFLTSTTNLIPDENDVDHTLIKANLDATNFINVISDYITYMDGFDVDAELIADIHTEYETPILTKLATIDAEITAFYSEKTASTEKEDLANINQLITNYKLTALSYSTIAYNSVILNAFTVYSNEQVNNFKNFENINLYQLKEGLTKELYLFQNEVYEYEYALPFAVTSTSNYGVNAFDFAYFTLEIFSFIIIIYVVVIGASSIAGEEANGTMKLLAIRPYKRYKILLGKIWSTLKIGLGLLIIGGIVSMITGFYLYGTESMEVLSVINTDIILISSPYITLAIYLATLFIEIMFYVTIAVAISTIFRSYTGAVTMSILIYFASMIVGLLNGAWLKYIPLTSADLFKYFGNSFVGSSTSSNINVLLTSKPLLDTDIVFAGISIFATILTFTLLSLRVFNKRDLK